MAYPNEVATRGQEVPTEDSWRHRSTRMRCHSCMWFVIKPTDDRGITTSPAGSLGRCRRHSPTLGGFPAVFQNDWCGDHKLDENKV